MSPLHEPRRTPPASPGQRPSPSPVPLYDRRGSSRLPEAPPAARHTPARVDAMLWALVVGQAGLAVALAAAYAAWWAAAASVLLGVGMLALLVAHARRGAARELALGEAERRVGQLGAALEAQAGEATAQAAVAEAERQVALAARRTRSALLSTLGHELRTPLNAIGGYAELLELGLRGPLNAQQLEDLGRIRRGQRQLLALLTDVLGYARLEAGEVELVASDVAAHALIGAVHELAAPMASAKGLRLERAPADHALLVHADAERAREALRQLVDNAIKFTDAGTVTLLAREDGDHVAIEVRDTGRGVPADRLAEVFEPFVQLDRHLLPAAQQGVGLGLAISRDLARAMGGDLAATSAPGIGTTFTLRLPRALAPAVAATLGQA